MATGKGESVFSVRPTWRRLTTLLSARLAGAEFPLPAPLRPVWVIGDVHGCADLLERLMVQIFARSPRNKIDVVLTGDYIDRGPDSCGTLSFLHDLIRTEPNVVCLRGNHEEMLFSFLDDPVANGRRWLRHGGRETLRSYGLQADGLLDMGRGLQDVADRLRDAMGPDVLIWLKSLPLQWSSGNVTVVHAALDPACALDMQSANTMLWGHPKFFNVPRSDGMWVVHGHTIVAKAGIAGRGRIAVDTGAYESGHLSGVLISPDGNIMPFLT